MGQDRTSARARSLVSGVYRLIKFYNSRNNHTLIAGVLGFVPILGLVIAILDAIAEYQDNRITLYVE